MNDPSRWSYEVTPPSRWIDLRLREWWRSRELIRLFVWRDFVALYKQTILGPLWYVFQPLLTSVVFTIVFGRIANLPTDEIPPFLFYMSGTVIWTYFASCVTKVSPTFTLNAPLFGKVYFPRITVPITTVISNLIAFGIQFVMLLGFVVYFTFASESVHPNAWALLVPALVVLTAGLGLGFGLMITSLTTRYRDLQYLVVFGVQLGMYLAPIVYPLSSVSGPMKLLIMANPMTSVIEAFRYGLLGAGEVSFWGLTYSAVMGLVTCVVGLSLFNRVERTFMDSV
jgi:lipopolysaccharide transport system permease protein